MNEYRVTVTVSEDSPIGLASTTMWVLANSEAMAAYAANDKISRDILIQRFAGVISESRARNLMSAYGDHVIKVVAVLETN